MPESHSLRKVFISHASEDKDGFVRSLAEILNTVGVDVWYDEYSLKAGDSLMSAIDDGLARCDFGIVVLSKAFLAKNWPKRELRGLVALEMAGKTGMILPVWLDVTRDEVLTFSPPLADAVSITVAGRDTWAVARDLLAAIDPVARFSLRAARALRPDTEDQDHRMMVTTNGIIPLPPRPLLMPGHLAVRAMLCELAFPMLAEPNIEGHFTELSRDIAPEREILVHEVLASTFLSVLQEYELNNSERRVLRHYIIARSMGMDAKIAAGDSLDKGVRQAADSHYARLTEISNAAEFSFLPADLPEQVTLENSQRLVSSLIVSEPEIQADVQRMESLLSEKNYGEAARVIESMLLDIPTAATKETFSLRSIHAYALGMSGRHSDAVEELLALMPEAAEYFGVVSEESFNVRANHADFTGMAGDTLRAAQLYERLVLDIETLDADRWSTRLENMQNAGFEYLITFMERVRETRPSESETKEAARLFRAFNERMKVL
jgi:TIR domain